MIIVSQDKESIVNFDNIVYLDIEKNSFNKYVIECYYNSKDEDFVWLGEYETEERAKEVLKEITKVYKFYKGMRYTIGDRNNLLGEYEYGVYEMPEK